MGGAAWQRWYWAACVVAAALAGGCTRAGFRAQSANPDASAADARAADTRDLTGQEAAAPLDASHDAAHHNQSLAVTDNLDDGEICFGWKNEWYPDGDTPGTTYAGYYATGGVPVWSYFRFQLATAIPTGSTVVSARLTLRGRSVYLWNNNRDALRVAAERRADAVQVAGIDDRPGGSGGTTLTGASVRWPGTGPLAWDTSGDNTSPDLSPVLQELVDMGGLAAGAHVQLWVDNPDVTVDAEVGVEDYSASASNEARLTIGWYQP